MPFETWKRDALQHYVELARIPVPGARLTALQQAAEAEREAAPFLDGLKEAVEKRIDLKVRT